MEVTMVLLGILTRRPHGMLFECRYARGIAARRDIDGGDDTPEEQANSLFNLAVELRDRLRFRYGRCQCWVGDFLFLVLPASDLAVC